MENQLNCPAFPYLLAFCSSKSSKSKTNLTCVQVLVLLTSPTPRISLCITHWCVKVIFQSSGDITYVLWQSLSCPEAACPLVPCEVWLPTGVMLISFIFTMQNASELWSHAHHHAQLAYSSHSSIFQELHRWPAQWWSAANKNPNAVSTHLFPVVWVPAGWVGSQFLMASRLI